MNHQVRPERPAHFAFGNVAKATLPFPQEEYDARIAGLRTIMAAQDLDAAILTSIHGVAYYSGFLYCSFGRSYACVITRDRAVTISADIDGANPARRSACENLVYTDWRRDNFWRAVRQIAGAGARVGVEGDHLTLAQREKLGEFLGAPTVVDIAPAAMRQRMIKSAAEISLIREGARIADLGGEAIRDAIRVGAREIDVAIAGRDAMEREIARAFPDSELRDTWV
jgi:creatinase